MAKQYWEMEASLEVDPDNEDCQSLFIWASEGSSAEIAGKIADERVAKRLLRLWNTHIGVRYEGEQ